MLIEHKEFKISGRFVKIVKLADEGYEYIENPELYCNNLKNNADIFTFVQKVTDISPKYNYYMEWDNVAALPIDNFDHWWKKQIKDKTRNMIRKAEKKGVIVRIVEFNDEFVHGISSIYNETPIRQGRPFWHYGKNFEAIKSENSTYLNRSHFIGAYYNEELIGFAKLVIDGRCATIMQILSKIQHRDKAPTNSIISKAVEICARDKIMYLIYAKYYYGKKGVDPLNEFKQHNGFIKKDIPRYYVPLTSIGRIAMKLKLHNGVFELLPSKVVVLLLKIRDKVYKYKYLKIKGD